MAGVVAIDIPSWRRQLPVALPSFTLVARESEVVIASHGIGDPLAASSVPLPHARGGATLGGWSE